MTGPKISFWIISSSWRRSATTVGSKKKPDVPLAVAAGGDLGVVGRAVDEAGDPRELVGVVDRAVQDVGSSGAPVRVPLACSVSASTKSP